MSSVMTELFNKVQNYSYSQRIQRLIELHCRQEIIPLFPLEIIEMELIQEIRTNNGEIEAVIKMREITDNLDKENDKD